VDDLANGDYYSEMSKDKATDVVTADYVSTTAVRASKTSPCTNLYAKEAGTAPDLTKSEGMILQTLLEHFNDRLFDRSEKTIAKGAKRVLQSELHKFNKKVKACVPLAAKEDALNSWMNKVLNEDFNDLTNTLWMETPPDRDDQSVETNEDTELERGWLLIEPDFPAKAITKVDNGNH